MLTRWRHPPDMPFCLVSNWGAVQSWPGGRLRALSSHRDGYVSVLIQGRTWLVHHLVLLAFRGPRPSPLHQGHHKDSDTTNNVLSNLAWVTPQENRAALRELSRSIKLSAADIERIRTVDAADEEWAQLFRVKLSTIRTIKGY